MDQENIDILFALGFILRPKLIESCCTLEYSDCKDWWVSEIHAP